MSLTVSPSETGPDNTDFLDSSSFEVSPVVDEVIFDTTPKGDVRIRVLSQIPEPQLHGTFFLNCDFLLMGTHSIMLCMLTST